MKKWPLILTIVVMLALYGVFLVCWFAPKPEPAVPTTEPLQTTVPTTAAPTTEPAAVPTTTAAPTTEPTTVPTTEPTTVPTEPPVVPPDESALKATSVFVYDQTDDRLLYTLGDQNQQIAPASLTKLLTAMVVLEYLEPETVVEAGVEASWAAVGSSVAAIHLGNRLSVEMLLEGMLLQSGNDAAYVLAVAAGRAIGQNQELTPQEALERFMEEMERKCKDLGLEGSSFLNPDGYDQDGHYSTPADLLTLARQALQEPLILKYTKEYRDHVVYASGQDYVWLNTNMLVDPTSKYYCEDAFGLKTGSTESAGYCLIGAFEREGRVLLIGVMGCPNPEDRFVDILYLYDHFISQ